MIQTKKGAMIGLIFLITILSIMSVNSEKLDIQLENNYLPGEEVNFKIILYNDENNKIQGQINYIIQNYYSEIVASGTISSGEDSVYRLPQDSIQGPWKISANYGKVEVNRLFNVGELEKSQINLQGDILKIKNIGNTVYEKKILIYIGSSDQTIDITLDIGQSKEIRLTAPDGKYDIKIIEGNDEKTLEFKEVSLTGNVVGLERILEDNGFWQKNKIIALFLGTLLLVIFIIAGLKIKNKLSK